MEIGCTLKTIRHGFYYYMIAHLQPRLVCGAILGALVEAGSGAPFRCSSCIDEAGRVSPSLSSHFTEEDGLRRLFSSRGSQSQ